MIHIELIGIKQSRNIGHQPVQCSPVVTRNSFKCIAVHRITDPIDLPANFLDAREQLHNSLPLLLKRLALRRCQVGAVQKRVHIVAQLRQGNRRNIRHRIKIPKIGISAIVVKLFIDVGDAVLHIAQTLRNTVQRSGLFRSQVAGHLAGGQKIIYLLGKRVDRLPIVRRDGIDRVARRAGDNIIVGISDPLDAVEPAVECHDRRLHLILYISAQIARRGKRLRRVPCIEDLTITGLRHIVNRVLCKDGPNFRKIIGRLLQLIDERLRFPAKGFQILLCLFGQRVIGTAQHGSQLRFNSPKLGKIVRRHGSGAVAGQCLGVMAVEVLHYNVKFDAEVFVVFRREHQHNALLTIVLRRRTLNEVSDQFRSVLGNRHIGENTIRAGLVHGNVDLRTLRQIADKRIERNRYLLSVARLAEKCVIPLALKRVRIQRRFFDDNLDIRRITDCIIVLCGIRINDPEVVVSDIVAAVKSVRYIIIRIVLGYGYSRSCGPTFEIGSGTIRIIVTYEIVYIGVEARHRKGNLRGNTVHNGDLGRIAGDPGP